MVIYITTYFIKARLIRSENLENLSDTLIPCFLNLLFQKIYGFKLINIYFLYYRLPYKQFLIISILNISTII